MMKHPGRTNSAGVEETLLPLIAEPLDGPKVFAVGVLKPFQTPVARLGATIIRQTIIN